MIKSLSEITKSPFTNPIRICNLYKKSDKKYTDRSAAGVYIICRYVG